MLPATATTASAGDFSRMVLRRGSSWVSRKWKNLLHTFLFLPGSSQIPGVVLQIVHSVQHSNNLFWSQKTLLTLTQFCPHSDYACICWIAALHLLLSLARRLRDYPDTGFRMFLPAPIHSQPILSKNRAQQDHQTVSTPDFNLYFNLHVPIHTVREPIRTTRRNNVHREPSIPSVRMRPFLRDTVYKHTHRCITHNVLTL